MPTEFLGKLGCEARVSVADDLQRQPKTLEYLMEVEASYTLCRNGFGAGDE